MESVPKGTGRGAEPVLLVADKEFGECFRRIEGISGGQSGGDDSVSTACGGKLGIGRCDV